MYSSFDYRLIDDINKQSTYSLNLLLPSRSELINTDKRQRQNTWMFSHRVIRIGVV